MYIGWDVAFTSNEFGAVNVDDIDDPHIPAFESELQVRFWSTF